MSPEIETKIRALLLCDGLDLDVMTLNGEWPDVLGMLSAAMEEIYVLRAGVPVVPEFPRDVRDLHGERMRGMSLEMYHRGWSDLAARARAVPADRVLKEDEIAIKISEWDRIQTAISKIRDAHDPEKMLERCRQYQREHRPGTDFEKPTLLKDGWATTHGTSQDPALRSQNEPAKQPTGESE